ncbi:MAG: cytochrome c oxidase subunit II [Acidobacteriaceae bacterium]|nr:cytochrome c oxidase subunit II [Acidobacteriaceae bacterium]
MAATLWTLTQRERDTGQGSLEARHQPSEETNSRLKRVVTGLTVATIVILFGLIVASVGTGKATSELGNKKNGLTVEVSGNQWWWQIRYVNSDPSQELITANEIHIPVGRPVQIRGLSKDVIHSFWVPNLNGKRDLIPSRTTTEWIEADYPGLYRGQCAEFCGLQHAHMALWVIAEPQEKFNAWMRAQLQPAVSPSDPEKQRGQQVFLNQACVFCHQIRGTSAAGQNAPDLTHFGSRRGIAANTVPNTKGNLAGWIVDPQSMKPGNHMATIALASNDLQPLIDYLESLK